MNFTNGKYNQRQIFSDMVSLETYFINVCLIGKTEYAEEFDKIIGKYSKEEQSQILNILLSLAQLYEKQETTVDILGMIYNELQIYNKNTGQFFTPTHISDLMAEIDGLDEKEIKENGYIALHEPCVGAGGMVLSFAKMMKNKGYDPKQNLFVVAWDIDILCTYMSYVQLSMYDIPAIVVNGDTLTLKENMVLYTPQYYKGFWNFKGRKIF